MRITSLFAKTNSFANAVGLNTPLRKILAAAIVSSPFTLKMTAEYGSVDVDRCHIEDTAIKDSGGKDIYLVFTRECGVYRNTDSLWWAKFNSSDIQAKANKAKRTTDEVIIKSNDWRNYLTSNYPNILDIIPVAEGP